GGSLGVAVMGTIIGMRMQPLFNQYDLAGASGGANALLDPEARGLLDPDVLAVLQAGMTEAITTSFLVMAVAVLAGFVAMLWFPRRLPDPEADASPPSPPA